LKIGGSLIVFAAILISYKRTALFAFITSIPVYFYARMTLGTSGKSKRLIPAMFGGALLLILLVFSFKYISAAVGLDWVRGWKT